jgi:ubiquinone/menaquinone biosynthesis C-methylase UbiE
MKSKDAQSFTNYYRKNKVTGTYDNQREGTKYRRDKRRVELRVFLELLDKKDGEKVLELGCSSGFLTKELGEVTAIDTSEDMLKIAHAKNPQAKCIPGDMFKIPFRNNYFDKVVTMRVWNHLDEDDLRKALKETKRVLKKNGVLVFDAEEKSFLRRFIGFFYQKIFRITGYKIYQYSLKELFKILKEEGFKIEKIKIFKHRVGRQIVLRCRLEKK